MGRSTAPQWEKYGIISIPNESTTPRLIKREDVMPEIARFFGITIRMYAEPGAPHHRPHFHAYYQDELLGNWNRLQQGRPPIKVAPLR